jgi:NADH dehydrogenase [ubiquinone] 1 alpha subcomplex assembly factor 1
MYLLILIISLILPNPIVIFDFNAKSDTTNWRTVNDGVMGGISESSFSLGSDGNGVFEGTVSLENNGGFCSVQHFFKVINLESKKVFVIRLKGDGKKYQFRAKSSRNDYYSYVYEFQTTNNWESIEIPIRDMSPSFRGRRLDMPNYEGAFLEEIAFLIGNKKGESFQLQLDKIEVR